MAAAWSPVGFGATILFQTSPVSPFDLEPVAAVQAHDLEGRRLRPVLLEDLADRRHVIAVEVDEAQGVGLQEIEERRRIVVGIADLDRVRIALGRPFDELPEPLEERLFRRHLLLVEILELEHDRAEPGLERGEGLEKTAQDVVVEEEGIGLSAKAAFCGVCLA